MSLYQPTTSKMKIGTIVAELNCPACKNEIRICVYEVIDIVKAGIDGIITRCMGCARQIKLTLPPGFENNVIRAELN